MSIRDKILSVQDDTPTEVVTIPEWDVDVLVKGFTLGAKDDFLASILDPQTRQTNIKAFNAGVIVGCCYDPETNDRLFTETDIPALKERSAAIIQRLVDVGTRLSGLTDDAVAVAGKKSSSTQNEEPSS